MDAMNAAEKEIYSSLVLELRRGVIVLAVLSQLAQPMYGYNLVSVLSGAGVEVEANTLYPLLRRLEGQGLLQSSWDTAAAKPRKYYSLTPMGHKINAALKENWRATTNELAALLGE